MNKINVLVNKQQNKCGKFYSIVMPFCGTK